MTDRVICTECKHTTKAGLVGADGKCPCCGPGPIWPDNEPAEEE